ncbi:hypothetical protein E2553_31160 [Paraburkholderia dipogonis]|uniref:Uncharacterized protein n=2 Tax=Paraburkholderia dipogonis TaxID=1211383 RepID=A0A4Y8MUN9_9BURK|nr:hypothetical protein [Paraburkholderia dipogonis]TFE41149.1 hypothetical protein E2553_31160 [Paraburkholderia dipogonis]
MTFGSLTVGTAINACGIRHVIFSSFRVDRKMLRHKRSRSDNRASSALNSTPQTGEPPTPSADADLDEALEATFPASDPIAVGGVSRIETTDDSDLKHD